MEIVVIRVAIKVAKSVKHVDMKYQVQHQSTAQLNAREGYQFDYVFDWTVLKCPQIGGSSKGRHTSGRADKRRSSSRYGSTSRRAVAASRPASSSGEPSDIQQNRLVSSGGRMSTTQRIQLAFQAKTSSRAAPVRGSRDDDQPLEVLSCSRLGNNGLLLVDKKITHPKEMFKILDSAVKEKYPIVVVAEDIEQVALALVIWNKLKCVLKAAAIKAPAFGEHKSHCLDDIAILTGATVIRDDMGLTLYRAGKEVLGTATKVVITKDSTYVVSDGNTREAVQKRVSQIERLVEVHITFLVGAQTQVDLKDKQLRIEDALNATKIGAEIFKRALSYPTKLIAENAGVNGSVVVEKVLFNDDIRYGYNAASNSYEDLMKAGIMDPTKVVRCCLENAASVAKTFLTSDAVVVDIVDIKEFKSIPKRKKMPKLTSSVFPKQLLPMYQ
ncbi:Chaperonin Cpn60/GroEL/TCP-1 family - like 10 [Theobroma cacao]|nr:Chaperonin Cpn60/GroEL/TCP-1 family - like 10 [Theobroma cacao]